MPADTESLTDMVALNADVVGYSRLMADDLEATSEAMRWNRHLVEEKIVAGGGTLANFVGDNFMAVFADAKDAVQTAIEISTEVEGRNVDVAQSRQVRFRMGLDTGEVTITEGHYQGDSLNIAARIQAVAPAGGVSVSGRVYRALDEPALRFRPTGEHRMKNIPEPVYVYDFADLPTDGGATTGLGSLSLEIPIIAVLPVHTELVDDAIRAAATVVRSDMIHRLAAVPGLRVIDAGTMTDDDPARAAARYMLETGVHQFGDSVRVFATLFDVSTMNVVKSHKWSTSVSGIVDLFEEAADEVARAIEVELVVGQPAGLYAELDDAEAIQNVYLGWYHLRSGTQEGWVEALELFGQVAEAHPDRPYGYTLSAFALWAGSETGWGASTDEMLQEADRLAGIGVEVGDPTGMAKAVQAAVLMSMGRFDEAMERMEEVEIIRPTCDVTYGLEGSIRRYMGDWEEAVDLLDVAMRLTGMNKPWYPTVKACSLFIGNRLEQAASVAEEVLEYQPNNLEALLVLAAAQVELKLDRRATATAQVIRDTFPATDIDEWLSRSPYQNEDIVIRWKKDLAAVGLSSHTV